MKKTLSIFLAITMIFSCFGIFSVSAADEAYTEEEMTEVDQAMSYFKISNLPERFDNSIEELRALDAGKAAKDKINLLGMDLDYLYTYTGELIWSFLDVFETDPATGTRVMKITKGEVAIMLSTVSAYLKDLFYSTYGGLKLYTVENAIALANAIGNMFFRDYENLTAGNFKGLFGYEIPSAQEFYEAVVELSGLGLIIQENWCPRGRNFCEPVVEVLTGGYVTIHVDNYANGKELGARILEGIFAKMNIDGPVNFIVDLVNSYTRSYETTFREPTLALFTHKIEKILNFEYVEEYRTLSGLIKLIFCNCDPLSGEGCFASPKEDVSHFCPLEFPTKKFATAADKDETMLFLFYYLNLCGAYRNNRSVVGNLKSRIESSAVFADADKKKLTSIVDGYFLNNIDSTTKTLIEPYMENILQPSTGGLFDRLRNSLQVFLKKIADYFDYLRKLFSGELNYGEGGSPFI